MSGGERQQGAQYIPNQGEVFTLTLAANGVASIDLTAAGNFPAGTTAERFWAGRFITINCTAAITFALGDGTVPLVAGTAGPGLVAAGGALVNPNFGLIARIPNTLNGRNAVVNQHFLMFASTPGAVITFYPSSPK